MNAMYVPEPYIDRGENKARNKARNLTGILSEKAEFLDAKPSKLNERGKQSKKVAGKIQFVKVWKSLFRDQTQSIHDGEQPFSILSTRLPHIDILSMPMLAFSEYIRYQFNLRIINQYDVRTDVELIKRFEDPELMAQIFDFYSKDFPTFRNYLKVPKAKASQDESSGSINLEEQFKDIYRYIVMMCRFDEVWKVSMLGVQEEQEEMIDDE